MRTAVPDRWISEEGRYTVEDRVLAPSAQLGTGFPTRLG